MAPRSSILAWIIPWTEETGRLQFTRSQRVRHKWATEHAYNVPSESSTVSDFIIPLENMDKTVFMKTGKWNIIHPVWSLANEWMDRQTDGQSEGMKADRQGSHPKCWLSFLFLNFHVYIYNDQVLVSYSETHSNKLQKKKLKINFTYM